MKSNLEKKLLTPLVWEGYYLARAAAARRSTNQQMSHPFDRLLATF